LRSATSFGEQSTTSLFWGDEIIFNLIFFFFFSSFLLPLLGSFHLIRLYYEEFLNLLVDRQYTAMKKHELESKFPINFFSVIHPSMAIMLDHTSYFKQGPPSPVASFRPMPLMTEPLIPEPVQHPPQADHQRKMKFLFFFFFFFSSFFLSFFFFDLSSLFNSSAVGQRGLQAPYQHYYPPPQQFAFSRSMGHNMPAPNGPNPSYVSEYDVQNILSGFREEIHKKNKTEGGQ
jgi:hypothetical protein